MKWSRAARRHLLLSLSWFLVFSVESPVVADDYRTPRAGESATGSVFGQTVTAPARDRHRITYLNAGAILAPDGPEGKTFGPVGGLYLWRVMPKGSYRLRAIISVIANEARWDRSLSEASGFSFVATFDSLTPPWARSEAVHGASDAGTELEWHQARGGVGIAWRKAWPGDCDNGLDIALTLEPGALWFHSGSDTAPHYVLPTNTFEGRLHLRVRSDALERNIVELPHRGWAAGGDVTAGHRSNWEPWGLLEGGLQSGGETWYAANLFAFVATSAFPGLSERHRLISSVHAGIGSELDRFSAFRLGGGSTWGDFETLSRVVLPGAGLDELFASRYAIIDVEYRFEVFFFLYAQLRGTLAWAEVPTTGDLDSTQSLSLPAVTVGITTGLPWDFSLEASGSWNFGIPRQTNGVADKGGVGVLVSLTKEF
jgi:hypothetical protein